MGNALDLSGTHDVIIRFLAFARAITPASSDPKASALPTATTSSLTIARAVGATRNLVRLRGVARSHTVQWCIIAEGNNRQRHAFATALAGDRSTWHTTSSPTWRPAFRIG